VKGQGGKGKGVARAHAGRPSACIIGFFDYDFVAYEMLMI